MIWLFRLKSWKFKSIELDVWERCSSQTEVSGAHEQYVMPDSTLAFHHHWHHPSPFCYCDEKSLVRCLPHSGLLMLNDTTWLHIVCVFIFPSSDSGLTADPAACLCPVAHPSTPCLTFSQPLANCMETLGTQPWERGHTPPTYGLGEGCGHLPRWGLDWDTELVCGWP